MTERFKECTWNTAEMTGVLIIISVILLFLCFWRRSRKPPGPVSLPIVGYLPWLNPKAPHLTLTELSKIYGPVYGLYLGSVYTVVVSDAKLVKKLFMKDVTTGRAPLYLTHGIMKGFGIICAEKELWKDQRRFVFSCFKQLGMSKIGTKKEKMQELIMKEVIDLINYINHIEHNLDGKIVLDPHQALKHNLGSTVYKIIFGKSFERDNTRWNWLLHLQEEGTRHIGVAGPLNFLPFLRFLPKFKGTVNFLLDGKTKTHNIYQKFIDEQAIVLKELREDPNFQPDNMLHAFLIEREKRQGDPTEEFYCPTQFHHLLADIFGAGLDTTLTTLRWYLLYMANYPQVQSAVREEIDNIVQSRAPSLTDLSSMPYAEASLLETQRIRSVVPVGIPHGSIEEVELEGFQIPVGTMIIPLQWAIHMSDETWSDPEVFDPMRFISEEGKLVKKEGFIPFQAGKRMCVGDEFARMLLFLFGTTILQNFVLTTEDGKDLDTEGECGITLTPRDYKLVFTPRTRD